MHLCDLLLSKGLAGKATILLSLSFVLKPISLPLLGLPLFAPLKNRKKSLVAFLIIVSIFLLLAFLPFYLLGWVLPASSNQVTSYFRMAGGLTLFSVVELIKNTAILPIGLEFLGYLWVPALILGYIWVYLNPPKNTCEFITGAILLLLIFFLTRSWVSEPNLNLFLPLFLILLGYGKISDRLFHLSWILPLVFIFLNYSFPQLFF